MHVFFEGTGFVDDDSNVERNVGGGTTARFARSDVAAAKPPPRPTPEDKGEKELRIFDGPH